MLSRTTAVRGQLLAGGLAADTPAALVSAAHTPRQRQLVTTLGDAVDAVARAGLGSPAVLVVGEVVRRAAPGAGQRVPEAVAAEVAGALAG